MKVSEVMTQDVCLCSPEDTIENAAHTMADMDIGILPIGKDDKLVGMVTDRDIAIRAVGEGKSPSTRIGEVMSKEVLYCFEDDDVEDILNNMSQIQVRRLPVLDRDKRLIGIVSISDLASTASKAHTAEALSEITRRSRLHTQTP
jgi:CBS domain-containing protein